MLRGCLAAAAWLCLSVGGWSAPADYDAGALKGGAPSSLPGRARGVVFQSLGSGPLQFSVDGAVLPNVYVPDGKGAQVRRMLPTDVPSFSLIDADVNQGKGLHGLNGARLSHWKVVGHLPMSRLSAEVDGLQRSYGPRVQAFFHQRQKGRDRQLVEATWLRSQQLVEVRFARSVVGRDAMLQPGGKPRWNMWRVPYMTVVYRLHPDGRLVDRVVIPPGDPKATAVRYNPGGSPW